MKLAHVTPHLGGDVGKAHAAIASALPDVVQHTYILLEEPRERRHADALAARGAEIVVPRYFDEVAALVRGADVVQFDFWDHPRLLECLACTPWPQMRTMVWSHISGLAQPFVPAGLIETVSHFAFTTPAALSQVTMETLSRTAKRKVWAINSNFGFTDPPAHSPRETPTIAYLGAVDFTKMHPGFFDAIERLEGDDIRAMIWGDVDPSGEAAARAQAMQHSKRIQFFGKAADEAHALSEADIFFYPLRPGHSGVGSALIEAMSLGLVPVVFDNPHERTIIRDGETGLVARSVNECVFLLQKLLTSRELRERIGGNAARYAAENKTPAQAAQEFMILWLGMLSEPKRVPDFRSAIGETPEEWRLAMQHANRPERPAQLRSA